MDPLSIQRNMFKFGRVIFILALFVGMAFANTTNLTNAMTQLCNDARMLLGIGAMLLVILAAAVYAIGQIVGAETRARASVWATAMLTGAVIGMVIYMLVPPLIGVVMGGTVTQGDPCAYAGPA